jgi:hypothetical protein
LGLTGEAIYRALAVLVHQARIQRDNGFIKLINTAVPLSCLIAGIISAPPHSWLISRMRRRYNA